MGKGVGSLWGKIKLIFEVCEYVGCIKKGNLLRSPEILFRTIYYSKENCYIVSPATVFTLKLAKGTVF